MTKTTSGDSTYYEILEVHTAASPREILAAYNRARETYSPESPALYTMFSPDEARQLLKVIEEAFATLSNQMKRQEYDLSLAQQGHPDFSGLLKGSTKEPPPRRVSNAPAVSTPVARGNSKDELPDGFARTKFGIYEIDKNFESEYSAVEECDGAFVQRIRLYKKASLEQLSDATRVSKTYLAAIENNAFDALPAPVFVRGFVVQIARTLAINDKVLADAYMKYFRKHTGG